MERHLSDLVAGDEDFETLVLQHPVLEKSETSECCCTGTVLPGHMVALPKEHGALLILSPLKKSVGTTRTDYPVLEL